MTDTNTSNADTVIQNQEQLRQRLVDQGWWVSVPLTTFPSRWLLDGEQRLDGRYYATDAMTALRVVQDSGFDVRSLESVAADVFYLNRFKRVYAADKAEGVPFLTPSQMLHFRPASDKCLAYSSGLVDECLVKPGWILVTRSGSVGRCVMVGQYLSRFALSDDAIRIRQTCVPAGYLYAFLSSWIGQALMSKDQYGSAIKHLEPHHIAAVPVPMLPADDQARIQTAIARAYALRDEANNLLDDAEELLHSALKLPRFDESLVPYLSAPSLVQGSIPTPHPRAFDVQASQLNDRFDASHHIPIARTAVRLLEKAKYAPIPLGEMATSISIPPRFKRIYVKREYGVPFLRPSQLPQISFFDLGYISRLTKELDALTLQRGDVLVSTDGTVGRISMVTKYIAGWAGSNNIGRITCSDESSCNGYVAAFLSSPYGYHQLTCEIYGGVVDHIEAYHIAGVLIPDAPPEVREEIGKRAILAYEKKDEAAAVERAAIQQLETALAQHTEQ